ncbi:hypothetical protein EXS62_00490 [Candidatus Kaiserbacteria bacterium]|nr:hypothetical protein [Candidatus Kaiserbacteria bacterium]
MREFKKRRTYGAEILRIAGGSLGIGLLAAAAVIAGRGAYDMYGKFAEAAAARTGAEAQLAELQGRQAAVETAVEGLSNERGVEGAVRERYGVARPGEGQIDIVRSASSSEALRQEKGMFEKLWDLLFVW